MAPYRRFVELAGAEIFRLGCRAKNYAQNDDGTVILVLDGPDGELRETDRLLIGADGIHSTIRAQMHPDQPLINWGGALMWRGTTLAKLIRTGSSFVGLGTHRHRMVIYPISHPDPETGLALINWIAEVTYGSPSEYENVGWFRQVRIDDFIHNLEGWTHDWLDVPTLIRGAAGAYENPMSDRDPIPIWINRPVARLGDAAHTIYPTGSGGASQAVIDARVLGAKLVKLGITEAALAAHNEELCEPVSALLLRNWRAGTFG